MTGLAGVTLAGHSHRLWGWSSSNPQLSLKCLKLALRMWFSEGEYSRPKSGQDSRTFWGLLPNSMLRSFWKQYCMVGALGVRVGVGACRHGVHQTWLQGRGRHSFSPVESLLRVFFSCLIFTVIFAMPACSVASIMSDALRPKDCSPPGSSVHGILQVRTLEWVAMPSSRGSSQPRDWTWVSCTAGGFFTTESPSYPQFQKRRWRFREGKLLSLRSCK